MRKWLCILFTGLVYGHSMGWQIKPFRGNLGAKDGVAERLSINIHKGTSIQQRFTDGSKTPYFTEAYKYADVILTKGRFFEHVKSRINLVTQEANIISTNGIELNLGIGNVKGVIYNDTTDDGISHYKFQTGFPSIDKQDSNHFYLVLAGGYCSLLESIIKKATGKKNVLYGEEIKEYEIAETYYLFVKGEMKRLKKDKNFILSELSDKQAQVNQFVQSNKTNFKKDDQLVKLINFYNSLQVKEQQ